MKLGDSDCLAQNDRPHASARSRPGRQLLRLRAEPARHRRPWALPCAPALSPLLTASDAGTKNALSRSFGSGRTKNLSVVPPEFAAGCRALCPGNGGGRRAISCPRSRVPSRPAFGGFAPSILSLCPGRGSTVPCYRCKWYCMSGSGRCQGFFAGPPPVFCKDSRWARRTRLM